MTDQNLDRTLVLIPARMASTRLPGKPLAEIAGVPIGTVMSRLARGRAALAKALRS